MTHFEKLQAKFPKGTQVSFGCLRLYGKTISDVYSTRIKSLYCVEVQWNDGSKSSENVKNINLATL